MAELTPNTNVSALEKGAFFVGDQVYKSYLRDLLIEKIDNPEHEYDDRVLAMCDGAFGYSGD